MNIVETPGPEALQDPARLNEVLSDIIKSVPSDLSGDLSSLETQIAALEATNTDLQAQIDAITPSVPSFEFVLYEETGDSTALDADFDYEINHNLGTRKVWVALDLYGSDRDRTWVQGGQLASGTPEELTENTIYVRFDAGLVNDFEVRVLGIKG